MKTLNLIQGSPEWLAHRAQPGLCNASDAPAMMGVCPHKKRDHLIREKATGLVPEVSEWQQSLFDLGHEAERAARARAERFAGVDFAPAVVVSDDGTMSASLDGVDMDGERIWEHKMLNESLRQWARSDDSELPLQYRVQIEHQLMVSGARYCLFMASTPGCSHEEVIYFWYESDPMLRAHIVAGWVQFWSDVATYKPRDAEVIAVGRAPDALPALRIELTGQVTTSNLAEYRAAAIAIFRAKRSEKLSTDQDFADAEETIKMCSSVETKLESAKAHALSQTASIDQLFGTIEEIREEARTTRLSLERLVKARKDARREEIAIAGRLEVAEFLAETNRGLAPFAVLPFVMLVGDIAAAMKNKKLFSAMESAVNDVVARAKTQVKIAADLIRANAALLDEVKERSTLFPDASGLVHKPTDDLRNLITSRIAADDLKKAAEADRAKKEQEAARLAAEEKHARELVEAEERGRIAAKAAAEREAQVTAPIAQEAPKPQPIQAIEKPSPVLRSPARFVTVETMNLGAINAALAPLWITADGLATLGFHPAGKEGAAKLYRASDFRAAARLLAKRLADIGAAQ